MTTGELIKVLADYCPDTKVEVRNVTSNIEPYDRDNMPPAFRAGHTYVTYDDDNDTILINRLD